MILIDCRDMVKTYESEGVKTQAVRGVNVSIEKGEFVSIMGPSGSGKSTLMHILGLLEDATSGEYFFSGERVSELPEDRLAYLRNRHIGFVFQSFNLLPRTSVFENVELPLLYDIYGEKKEDCEKGSFFSSIFGRLSASSRSCHERKIRSALASVGMEHRIGYRSNQLSGGEKQRAAIARALVNNPELIFADEPTGNLDSKSGLQVMQILQDLNEKGHTVVLVTHETYTAEHARRIIRLRDGRVESDETRKEWRDARKERSLK